MKAVVTGASGGIGTELCRELSTAGYAVTGLDLHSPSDRTTASAFIECDVANAASVDAAAMAIGPADLLVNCAGIWRFAPLEDVASMDFARVLDVNLLGAFHCMRAFGRPMLGRGSGCIVNVVSIAAAHANPAVGAYSASKAGLVALTRQAAVEWGPSGVRVNAVGPGLVPTEGAGLYADEQVRRQRQAAVPLRRLGTPGDIARAVRFLASDDAAYVTGQVLYVDGGVSQTMMGSLARPNGVPSPATVESSLTT